MTLPTVEDEILGSEFEIEPATWVVKQAQAKGVIYLLAHADDGVIWGRVDDHTLRTSHDVAKDVSPPLRCVTLQQLHLFGPQGEWFVWRADNTFYARWLDRNAWDALPGDRQMNEDHILWGTEATALNYNFTRVVEGEQGFTHVVPLKVTNDALKERRLRLTVRHYIDYTDDGEARITVSRLVNIYVR